MRGLALILVVVLLVPGGALGQGVPAQTEDKSPPVALINRFKILYAVQQGSSVTGALGNVALVLVTKGSEDTSVGYLESAPDSTGNLWRHSGWSAVATARLFSNGPINYRIAIEFEDSFKVDGPSASGMLTIAILAALNGHRLREDATMTGMIMPDGSIGAVGCIKEKLEGARVGGQIKTVVLPRSVESPLIQQWADGLGVAIEWAGDIYEAYRTLVRDDKQDPANLPVATVSTSPVENLPSVTAYLRERTKIVLAAVETLEKRWAAVKKPHDPHAAHLAALAEALRKAAEDAQPPASPHVAYERALESLRHWYVAVRRGEASLDPIDDLSQGLVKLADREIGKAALDIQRSASERRARLVTQGAEASVVLGVRIGLERYASHMRLARLGWNDAKSAAAGTTTERSNPERADAMRLRAATHEGFALLGAVRSQDLRMMWPAISAPMRGGNVRPNAVSSLSKLFRIATASSGEILRQGRSAESATGPTATAAVVPSPGPDSHSIARDMAGITDEVATEGAWDATRSAQQELGDLGAAIELYLKASRRIAEDYAFRHADGACHATTKPPGDIQDRFVQPAVEFARARAREAIVAARDKQIDVPLAYHYYRYGEALSGGTLENKLLALEAFWRAEAQARVLRILGSK